MTALSPHVAQALARLATGVRVKALSNGQLAVVLPPRVPGETYLLGAWKCDPATAKKIYLAATNRLMKEQGR